MIEVSNLSVTFGLAQAVRDASLTIPPGARIGIVGESGSGKSMLGLALMGMAPDAARVTGSLIVDGAEMSGASERDWRRLRARHIAMIFQEPMAALNPLVRVGDTVAEPLRIHEGLSRDAALDRALALFKEVGLPNPEARLRQFPHEISGGQRQRVLIALALACNPGLLIADEPTTALDANVALRVTELLTDLSVRRQMSLLFISHDLTAVARATTEIVVMYGGTVVERGPTDQVLNAPRHPYTKGLLAARPRPEGLRQGGVRRRLPTIPGTVPPLDKLPPGCRFAGRCPVELPQCAATRPPVVDNAACHLLAAGGAA